MSHSNSKRDRPTRKVILAGTAIVALVLTLLYLQGQIGSHKVAPGRILPVTSSVSHARTVTVQRRVIDDMVDWPGTVRSRTVANIAPKTMARIVEVRVHTGTLVRVGEILAVLDDREVRSRLEQARSALAAAEARATQAEADGRRTFVLFQKQAATHQDLDAAQSQAKASRALATSARDALNEWQVLLADSTLVAPFDGVVTERLADPGDMAIPGKPVMVVQDRQGLRLEGNIGEHCASSLSVGADVLVRLDSLQRETIARVEEISPVADPHSRTFTVKAALEAIPELRPGVFGTMAVACDKHDGLLLPAAAVARIGQLETVQLRIGTDVFTRHVRTGKRFGDQVEILSGLREGDEVLVETE